MPLFYFDFKPCISGVSQRDHEGYDCFNEQEAKNHADDLALKNGTERPDLVGKGYISVIDPYSNEIHRSPV
jgi:hypothetical protein